MEEQYHHLGIYSDLVAEARRQRELFPLARPGFETQQRVREVLGFTSGRETPLEVRMESRWERDGVSGEEVSWWVGYGARTHAWVLRPAGVDGVLPGMMALHDHGGFKYFGKEKIASGAGDIPPVMQAYHQLYYGGRAYANALARAGFMVLVHDTFMWGSRRFPLEVFPEDILARTKALQNARYVDGEDPGSPAEIAEYNLAAGEHENVVEKYCCLLGTSMAGVVSHEDRIALNYLTSRADVDSRRVGCIGLSGGGNRTALLRATHDGIKAAAVIGLMSTYPGLLDQDVSTHTWMFFPNGWAKYGDWPDLTACRAPAPLLVQYDDEDPLFTPEGMHAADRRLAQIYREAGAEQAYTGQFYPGVHKFDLEMQANAFNWLKQHLNA
jgi:dienelactone hydrolase